jgi:hypothetical protein
MKKSLSIAICVASLLGSSMLSMSAQAEIYKWKDANGVVRYSDIPPPTNVPVESMKAKKAATPASAASDSAVTKTKSTAKATEKPIEVSPEKVKEAEAIIKKKNCDTAKNNLEILNQSGAYKLNEKGEQIELDEAAIAQEKEKAKKDIERNCN